MSKIRVFELAEKVGKTPQEVRDELGRRGKSVHSNLSLVEEPLAEALLAHYNISPDSASLVAPPKAAAPETAPPKAVEPPSSTGVTIDMTPPPRSMTAPKFAIPKKKVKLPSQPVAEVPAAPTAEGAVPAPPAAPAAPAAPRQLTTVNFDVPRREKPKMVEIVAPERPSGIVRRDGTAAPTPAHGGPGARHLRPSADKPASAGPPPAAGAPSGSVQPAPGSGAAGAGPKGKKRKEKKERQKDRERENLELLSRPKETEITVVKVEGAPRPLMLPEGSSISEMAQAMGIKASELIKKLMVDYKVMATVNQKLPKDVVETLALDYGFEVQHEGLYGTDLIAEESDDSGRLSLRAPVVTIMGHVDHGKTTLLDAIRDANVAAGESGGITQHIGAYKVHLPEHEGFPGGDVVFLDTPGHAAFTAMRARGAKATDIVVLVVAADDSVMPQTIEAIDHAKAANVPIVVAINKIDKEGANPDRVMQELGKYGLVPEAWGGSNIMVKLSAKKREGVKELLEMLALQAQVLELKADPGRRGRGVVIEAKLDKGRGSVATVLVQKGTLKVGDTVLVGSLVGRVRALIDDHGAKLNSAGPSTPAELLGLGGVPVAGDEFQAVEDEKLARQIAGKRQQAQLERERANRGHVKLEDLFDRISTGDMKELNLVIKADVSGSVEALKATLEEIKSDKVKARVIHGGVGSITESDVLLAAASDALILGFHVKAVTGSIDLAHKEGVEVRLYEVIYEAVNDVRDAMAGLLEPHFRESGIGKGEVKQIFKISKGYIVGSLMTSGKIIRDCTLRFMRGEEKVWEGKPLGLKRFKDDAKEVVEGNECGISLDPASGVQPGDLFEVLVQEEVAQKL